MTKHPFDIRGTSITSLVMDEQEFEEFLGQIAKSGLVNEAAVDACRKAKHVPIIAKGTKTWYLFDLYAVLTPNMSVIVRGEGENVFMRAFGN